MRLPEACCCLALPLELGPVCSLEGAVAGRRWPAPMLELVVVAGGWAPGAGAAPMGSFAIATGVVLDARSGASSAPVGGPFWAPEAGRLAAVVVGAGFGLVAATSWAGCLGGSFVIVLAVALALVAFGAPSAKLNSSGAPDWCWPLVGSGSDWALTKLANFASRF